MIGTVCKVVVLPEDGLREIFKIVSNNYNPDNEFEVIDLFWDLQEYGTNCIMRLDISEKNIERETEWFGRNSLKVKILKYLRSNTPEDIDTVLCPISY